MPQTPFYPPPCPFPVRPADVPKPVMTINHQKPDSHGNVNVGGTSGGDVMHADFADMQPGGKMTLDQVNGKVDDLIRRLKGTAAVAFALLSLSSFAELGPATRLGAVHPDTTLREVVEAGGGGGTIPTKVSDLENDLGFVDRTVTNGLVSAGMLPAKVSDLTNDAEYVTAAALPSKVSDLTNDAEYVTASVTNGVASDLTKTETRIEALQSGKRDRTDEACYDSIVHWEGVNKPGFTLVGQPYWEDSHWYWDWDEQPDVSYRAYADDRQTKPPTEPFHFWIPEHGDFDFTATQVRDVVPDPSHVLARRSTNVTANALAKFDAGGNLVTASASDIPHDDTKRDLTDRSFERTDEYEDWTPDHAEGERVLGEKRYENIAYVSGVWECAQYEWMDGWVYMSQIPMEGDFTNPDATELTFPDGTKTYKKRTFEDALALESQLAAKQDALSAAQLANIDAVPSKLDPDDPVLTATAPSVDAPATSLAGAKATGEALKDKADEFTEWATSDPNVQVIWDYEGLGDGWYFVWPGGGLFCVSHDKDAIRLDYDDVTATRQRVLRTGYIPSAISNDTTRIDADLTVTKVEAIYENWTPSHSTIPENPLVGDKYYDRINWDYATWAGWCCFGNVWNGAEWVPDEFAEYGMIGGYEAPDAIEMAFPDGTKTYKKRVITTKLATTNDVNGAISSAISTNNPAFASAVREALKTSLKIVQRADGYHLVIDEE